MSDPVSTEMGDRVGFNSRCRTSISVCSQPATGFGWEGKGRYGSFR